MRTAASIRHKGPQSRSWLLFYPAAARAEPSAGKVKRYEKLLNEAPIDLAFGGFGENGHIAFNDPNVADFEDPLTIKRITMDEASRKQQAGEGHFDSPASVAVTRPHRRN
jgi:glucosamine-6-phosphate deaminase